MVAHATKNNLRGKKMRTIDEDTTSAPNNPIEEEIGMTWLHKGSTMSHGETLATVSEELISKKEIALAKDVQEYIMPSKDCTKCM